MFTVQPSETSTGSAATAMGRRSSGSALLGSSSPGNTGHADQLPGTNPGGSALPQVLPSPLFLQMQWDNVAEPGEALGTCKSRKNLQIQEKPANSGKSLELASIKAGPGTAMGRAVQKLSSPHVLTSTL